MPIELQTRLLRVLAEGSFYRVGGAQPVRVDVRIVAATHQPLEQRVEQGLFREDLFHRLNVIRLRLPPLRERVEDIPALAGHFLTASARALGVPVKRLTPEALAVLTKFDFPGNVRQLENFCHWLTVMAPGQTVEPADLPPEIRAMEHQQHAIPAPRPAAPIAGVGTVLPTAAPADEGAPRNWQDSLLRDAQYRLERGEPAVMATLTRQFEKILLQRVDASRGRRVEAASPGHRPQHHHAQAARAGHRRRVGRVAVKPAGGALPPAPRKACAHPMPSSPSQARRLQLLQPPLQRLSRRPPPATHTPRARSATCPRRYRRSRARPAPDRAPPASAAGIRNPIHGSAPRSWPASWA